MDEPHSDDSLLRPPWAGPEIAVVAVLVAFAALVLGGLAAGIDSAAAQSPPFGALEPTWTAVQLGASWAGPLIAAVLLAATGLCWWQVDRWVDDARQSMPVRHPARGYVERALVLGSWAVRGLVLTAMAAVAGLVATIAYDVEAHLNQVGVSRVFGVAASVIGVAVMTVAGAVILRESMRTASGIG